MYLQFGAGQAFANPTTGNLAGQVAGTTASTQPVRFMTIQDIEITVDQALKELKGQYKFPDDVAPADMKITGKIGTGRISVEMFNQLFFADVYAVGETIVSAAEQHSIPATTPFTITVTNSATFATDLGVSYSNGQPFAKVASVTAAGQYSVSAGVYTFDTADAGAAVLISYTYTAATSGNTLTVNNQLMGYGPVFEIYLLEPYQGNNGLHLYAVRLSKLNMPIKRDDYLLTDLEFEAYPNASGVVMGWFAAPITT